MANQDKSQLDRLFLLEILVDTVEFIKPLKNLKQTCLDFQFLNYPPLTICEEDFAQNTFGYDAPEVTFYGGKSCLFSLPRSFAVSNFELNCKVSRMSDDGSKVLVGEGVINLGGSFTNLLNTTEEQIRGDPVTKVFRNVFPFSKENEQQGSASVYVRLSCFGKAIVTQFEVKGPEEKSFIFRGGEEKIGDSEHLLNVTSLAPESGATSQQNLGQSSQYPPQNMIQPRMMPGYGYIPGPFPQNANYMPVPEVMCNGNMPDHPDFFQGQQVSMYPGQVMKQAQPLPQSMMGQGQPMFKGQLMGQNQLMSCPPCPPGTNGPAGTCLNMKRREKKKSRKIKDESEESVVPQSPLLNLDLCDCNVPLPPAITAEMERAKQEEQRLKRKKEKREEEKARRRKEREENPNMCAVTCGDPRCTVGKIINDDFSCWPLTKRYHDPLQPGTCCYIGDQAIFQTNPSITQDHGDSTLYKISDQIGKPPQLVQMVKNDESPELDDKNDTFILKIGKNDNSGKPAKLLLSFKTPKVPDQNICTSDHSTQYEIPSVGGRKASKASKKRVSKSKKGKGKKGKKK